jgi:hypothetical protein
MRSFSATKERIRNTKEEAPNFQKKPLSLVSPVLKIGQRSPWKSSPNISREDAKARSLQNEDYL